MPELHQAQGKYAAGVLTYVRSQAKGDGLGTNGIEPHFRISAPSKSGDSMGIISALSIFFGLSRQINLAILVEKHNSQRSSPNAA